jgi:HAD superfamily hydrolase (TIGR01509 family)
MDSSQDFHDPLPERLQAGAQSPWPRAAVFDCDGLLVDTAACWRSAFELAARRFGRELSPGALSELNGASVRSAARILDVPAPFLRTELHAAFEQATFAALPGAALLVDRLRARIPLAVATNGPARLVSDALERVGLRDAFGVVISAEALPHDKPAPDVYLAACAHLGVDPSDAIAFEDSGVGATAARQAGLTVVLVPSNRRERVNADLRVGRLDDHRLLSLLRIEEPRRAGPGQSHSDATFHAT